jgi:hypothetical protein
MTTRNFRVKNGLSVGDIVISASANTITGLTTSAPSADGDVANKKYVDDQLSELDAFQITASDNTSVAVSDSGSDGTITGTVDGGVVFLATSANTTITASSNINLTAGDDVVIPANVGITFGDAGEKIEGNGTNLTISSSGELTMTATGTTTVTNNLDVGGNMIVTGNFRVDGTETILSSQSLIVEDAIIGLNKNISSASNMPRFSGIHLHRGTGSSATELDLYMVWDELTNASGSTTNLGGTFTFLGSVHEDGTETPNTGSFVLADIKCSTIEANLTGTATAAQYSDVAERFASDSMYEPGTVVSLGGAAEITAVAEEASDEVFGVISGEHQAAFKMNGAAGSNETHPYVAMTGRVQVKVMGAVNKGDRLISASVAGYARAATKAECTAFNVIGRALNSKQSEEAGSVLAAVRVSH